MKVKKILSLISLSSILVYALDTPPMPPMLPMEAMKNTKQKENKNKQPKSCSMIPPMVIFLPPPMEAELTKCKNELYTPKKEFAEKQLKKLFKKDVKVLKIESVKKFSQLYKITYDGGVILTNKSVDAFIKQ